MVSSVALLSDAAIESGNPLSELTLSNNMHGVAKLIDEQLFVSYRDPLITDTTLPAAIDRYRFIDNTLTFEHRYTESCDRMHGSAATDNAITFGCADGVLAIDLSQPNSPAVKLNNPASLIEGSRFGTLYVHHNNKEFVGVAGNQFYVIDISNASNPYSELSLPNNVTHIVKGFNANGDTFFILGSDGHLYLFDVTSDWKALAPVMITSAIDDADVSPAVTLSGIKDSLYILNTGGQEIMEINSRTGSVQRVITLSFTASRLVWLGSSHQNQHDSKH